MVSHSCNFVSLPLVFAEQIPVTEKRAFNSTFWGVQLPGNSVLGSSRSWLLKCFTGFLTYDFGGGEEVVKLCH